MTKKVVFVTGEKIGVSASETIHLYRRMVSFKKSGDVSVITQDLSDYPFGYYYHRTFVCRIYSI